MACGGFADSEADLALCASKAGGGVHHKQDFSPLCAEKLSDGGGDKSGFEANERGSVGRCADDDGAAHAFFAEGFFDKVEDFASTLTDQTDDVDLGGGVASDLSHECGLSDARTCEEADTLAFSDGKKAIDSANAEGKVFEDAFSDHGVGRVAFDGPFGETFFAGERRADHGLANAVEDTAKQGITAEDGEGLSGGDDDGVGSDAAYFTDGHEHDLIVLEANDFGAQVGRVFVADDHHLTDANAANDSADHQSDDLGDASSAGDGGEAFEAFVVFGEIQQGRKSLHVVSHSSGDVIGGHQKELPWLAAKEGAFDGCELILEIGVDGSEF